MTKLNLVLDLILIFIVGFVFTIWYWLLFPYKVIEFEPIELNKTTYQAGENLDIQITHCKYMPLPATMSRQFIDTIIYTLPDVILANSPTGCDSRNSIDIHIPDVIPPGEYLYRQTMVYQVNPIRKISVVFETPIFYIEE